IVWPDQVVGGSAHCGRSRRGCTGRGVSRLGTRCSRCQQHRHGREADGQPVNESGSSRMLPILLEWKLTVMLPQKTQEALVISGFHIEEAKYDPIVAAALLEPFTNKVPDLALRDFAAHVEWIDGGPERLPTVHESPEQIVGR